MIIGLEVKEVFIKQDVAIKLDFQLAVVEADVNAFWEVDVSEYNLQAVCANAGQHWQNNMKSCDVASTMQRSWPIPRTMAVRS